MPAVSDTHECGPIRQHPDAYCNGHFSTCKRCGLKKQYGKVFGSNKYPGFERVNPVCPMASKEEESQGSWVETAPLSRPRYSGVDDDSDEWREYRAMTLQQSGREREKEESDQDDSLEEEGEGDTTHQWSPQYQTPNGLFTRCKRCGITRGYGHAYGSLKYPEYERVNPVCRKTPDYTCAPVPRFNPLSVSVSATLPLSETLPTTVPSAAPPVVADTLPIPAPPLAAPTASSTHPNAGTSAGVEREAEGDAETVTENDTVNVTEGERESDKAGLDMGEEFALGSVYLSPTQGLIVPHASLASIGRLVQRLMETQQD
ncbi:hypothetical protein KIPB_000170 [Kipferlia bialata]|uniref:Uncharacterized protein n=1 Tax=Kipferlia bialata TaxID=797122 RepID=A0A9K3CN07_9EUKA|nr:hypothetical protein KIPB_000170 [Kipferlia bialata]|eukprot:g170.t1